MNGLVQRRYTVNVESQPLSPLSLRSRIALYRRISLEIGYLVFRNIFVLINLIIFTVVGLLILFGDTREGISLGIVISVNIILGLAQDINAWIVLERLQLLTALRITRMNTDGTQSVVSLEELQKGDRIKLSLGDQVPCDGTVTESKNLEVCEALITGESNSFPRPEGARILAGSIVTAGFGLVRVEEVFRESRIAKMTARIKRNTINESPLQQSIKSVVLWSGYVLLATLLFVVAKGVLSHTPSIVTVRTVGALAAILVLQGLVIAATLLFAFGGIHFYRRHVLLREVNATDKLARIKNLCLDKTGTLTENELKVESMYVPEGVSREQAERLAMSYAKGSGDSSQLIISIQAYLADHAAEEVVQSLPFSSWRQYGGVQVKGENGTEIVLAGAPEVFFPQLASGKEKAWVQQHIETEAKKGRRIFCMVRTNGGQLPQTLASTSLSVIALFILTNELREGTRATIDFFQDRGVRIRVLSGDNTETIRAVAVAAGIHNPEAYITGAEMEGWTQADFDAKAKLYTIFARVVPEQKEHVIEALKKDGFTAMIGDGANDALAIKKADVGIAMFDGTPATRQIAAVVLLRNSFAELPGGVRLADSILENLNIFGAIFFNQTFLGFFLFLLLTALGYQFPLSPLNISFATYFAVGIPGVLVSYWALRPSGEAGKVGTEPFLKKIIPFSLCSGIVGALATTGVFIFGTRYTGPGIASTLAVISFMVFGFIFFVCVPRVYSTAARPTRVWEVLGVALFEITIAFLAFNIPFVQTFFDLTTVPLVVLLSFLPLVAAYLAVQYLLTVLFVPRRVQTGK